MGSKNAANEKESIRNRPRPENKTLGSLYIQASDKLKAKKRERHVNTAETMIVSAPRVNLFFLANTSFLFLKNPRLV